MGLYDFLQLICGGAIYEGAMHETLTVKYLSDHVDIYFFELTGGRARFEGFFCNFKLRVVRDFHRQT